MTAVVRLVVYLQFALAVSAMIYLGLHLFTIVFAGSPLALPVQVDASCEPASLAGEIAPDGSGGPTGSCNVSITELYRGRFRITTDVPAMRLTFGLGPHATVVKARALLLRLTGPGAVRLEMRSSDAPVRSAVAPARVTGSGYRTVISLPESGKGLESLALVAESETKAAPFVLDEMGFFEEPRGLLNDVRPIFPWIPSTFFYGRVVPEAVVHLFVLAVIASFVVPGGVLRKLNPILLAFICFSFCTLDLAILFSPYGSHDLRLFYSAGPLQESPGTNLNIGVAQGFRLLHGEGLTYSSGAVPWSRMPGYGLFCALAGTLFGARTLLDLVIATVILQVVFYSVAVGCFAWAAGSISSPRAVFTLGLLIAFLPKELGYTQVDAIIAPIALLVMASLCLWIKASHDGRPVSLRSDVLVHLAFALWFVMRPDVLPGWLIVSLLLHWRQWRHLMIPVVLFLVIGFGWGAYKARYTHEFALTTSSAGASLFCGLWEVPSRFQLTCSDPSYFDWIGKSTSLAPQTQAANSFAVREVLRFWLTFPGHFVIMLDHKMMQCVDGECWYGLRTYLHEALFYLLVWPPRAICFLLTIIALSVTVRHERWRTLLFGWPLMLNAPLFWVMFASEGRFYGAIPIALLVAGLLPLFEPHFYTSLVEQPWRAASVLACAGIVATAAWPFHDWLLRADGFHYWTPLLDPSKSMLSGFK